MWAMTAAEVAQRNAEVAALYASDSLEDRLVAILRDLTVGDVGLHAKPARAKARAILASLGRPA